MMFFVAASNMFLLILIVVIFYKIFMFLLQPYFTQSSTNDVPMNLTRYYQIKS